MTLTRSLPCAVVNDTYEYCMRLSPLLVYKSTAQGFWPVMSTSVSGCTPESAARFRALGWFMASALVNRSQFPFLFSRALMTQVWPSSWPRGGAFVATEFDVLAFDEIVHQVMAFPSRSAGRESVLNGRVRGRRCTTR